MPVVIRRGNHAFLHNFPIAGRFPAAVCGRESERMRPGIQPCSGEGRVRIYGTKQCARYVVQCRNMAPTVYVRVYEELNDFLPPDRRKSRFLHTLQGGETIRQLLAQLGIPERQVDLVLVNGNSVRFTRRLKDEDIVSLYPVFESFDLTALSRPRRKPLRVTRFLVGAGLLPLANYLRLLGLDTLICRAGSLEMYLEAAEEDGRILLARDPALLERAQISRKYLVRAKTPQAQLLEVVSRFDLRDAVAKLPPKSPLASILARGVAPR